MRSSVRSMGGSADRRSGTERAFVGTQILSKVVTSRKFESVRTVEVMVEPCG